MRRRVVRLFERAGLLDAEAAENMRQWRHGGGFSLDASVAVEAHDRAGLERLLRYCARPAFSVERLSWRVEGERVLVQLGLPTEPPLVASARGPPLDGLDQTPTFELTDPAPVPEYEFDQTVSW